MSVIAPTLSHVLQNIERFKAELDSSADLQRRLAYARAWYALQTEAVASRLSPEERLRLRAAL